MKKLFTLIAVAFAALSVNAQTRTTLWEGEQVFDKDWPSVVLESNQYATAKSGDVIVVTVSKADNSINTEWQWGPQVFINAIHGEEWANLKGVSTANLTVSDQPAEATFLLNEAAIEDLATSTSIAVQGMNAVITKIELESTAPTTEVELSLVEGHTILAADFDSYADDLKVKISIVNNTAPYESRSGWGIGGFANADNWSPTYNIKGADGTEFDVYVTIGDFKTAAKNGTDAYVVSQYDRAGVTFNIYNDCAIKGVYVLVPEGAAVNTVTASKQAENGLMYNLAGQRVNESYKGVVIMNGKKFINK